MVDECHRVGAPSFDNICSWESDYVLGLSATPNRFSDPEGTQRIIDFCGDVVHTYTIDEAMGHGRLSNYFYYISQVGLTNDHEDCGETECSLCETDRYNLLMERVSSALVKFRDDNGLIKFNNLPKSVQVMIFNAKRILKRAHKKTDRCIEIIDDNYLPNSNQFWLIYCQDRRQLGQLKEELRLNNIGPVYEFWSEAEGAITDYEKLDFDRQATLAMWESTGGIMLSIQCLDEGVNIPCISHGIILASSQNPRQFIQRRGRLLRLSKNKTHAKIWDILVIPESDEAGDHRNYVFAELNRALTFSSNASNHHALQEIQSIAYRLGLSLELPILDVTDGEENDE